MGCSKMELDVGSGLTTCYHGEYSWQCRRPALQSNPFSVSYKCTAAGAKVANDALLAGDDLPGLYTLSRDGALFSWTYDHTEEALDRRKRRRVKPETATAATVSEDSHASFLGDASAEDSEPQDKRAASFSGQEPSPCLSQLSHSD